MQLSMQTLLKAQPAQHLIANKWQVAVGPNKEVRCPVGGELLEQLATGSVAGVEAAMDKIAKGFSQLKDRLPDTDLDSQFKAVQLKCVLRNVQLALDDRAPVLARTQLRANLPEVGHFAAPVVFDPVPPQHPLVQETVFGPVMAGFDFESEKEAIAMANGIGCDLVAAFWASNIDHFARLSNKLVVGQSFINCYSAGGSLELPFDDMKRSGHGREKGLLTLEEMSTTKTIFHYHG